MKEQDEGEVSPRPDSQRAVNLFVAIARTCEDALLYEWLNRIPLLARHLESLLVSRFPGVSWRSERTAEGLRIIGKCHDCCCWWGDFFISNEQILNQVDVSAELVSALTHTCMPGIIWWRM